MQLKALLALAATLSVAFAAPVDRLKQREEASPAVNTMYYDKDFDETAVKREEASPAVNTMYYDKDFDETAVKREEASPAANTMYYEKDFDETAV